MIIGITGSIGTGKSFIGNYFKNKGYKVIDTDEINANLLKKKKHVKNINMLLFNKKSKTLNKNEVRQLIFTNKEAKTKLEQYLHPLIYKKTLNELNKRNQLTFVEIPLLFETDFIYLIDQVIVVYTDEQTQIKRLQERNKLTEAEIKNIISNQMPLEEKKSRADYLINNNQTKEDVEKELNLLLKKLLRRL